MFKIGGSNRRRVLDLLRQYVAHRPVPIDVRLDAISEAVRRADPELFATTDLTRHELKVFSQNGEDGVLIEILNRIGVGPRYFVEFGIQSGHEGNTVLLADVFGWSGLYLESDPDSFAALSAKYRENPRVHTVQELVTADRFTRILTDLDVPVELDILSIDIDGNDVYVWDALEGFRPRVVVVEYNAALGLDSRQTQPHDVDRAWDGTGAYGAALGALVVVARRQGYELVHTDLTGNNAFFVRADLAPAVGVDEVPSRAQNFGLTGGTHPEATPEGGWRRIEPD